MTSHMALQELHHRQLVHRREAEIRRLARLARASRRGNDTPDDEVASWT